MELFQKIITLRVPDKFEDMPEALEERETSVYWDLKFKAASITHEKFIV
jgi:hypothetical protein